MKSLLLYIGRPVSDDNHLAIRSLMFLRLTILLFTSVVLFSLSGSDHSQVYIIGLPFVLVGTWSIGVLVVPPLSEWRYALLREIAIDFVWVLIVVWLTSRSANPFIYYYLVLTAISATILTVRQAWFFCAVGILIYTSLLMLDSQKHFNHFSSDYRTHLFGMWINYVASTLVSCFFIVRLTTMLRLQQAQLADVREDNLKNEQLIGLATVAASTVHTLATPVSTLTMLADELLENDSVNQQAKADAQLMRDQISRCRSTMKELSFLAQHGAELRETNVTVLVENIREHYALHHPDYALKIKYDGSDDYYLQCNELLQYAMINLINNAFENAFENVFESAENIPNIVFLCQDHMLHITIENTSHLPADTVFLRWGQPKTSDKKAGLGIGSFLANSTIEKQGGVVMLDSQRITSRSGEDVTHIIVTIKLPLAQVSKLNGK